MRVLVTGGAGYIGSHTVALLRARGDFVVVLDSLELGHREAIGDTPLVVGRTQRPGPGEAGDRRSPAGRGHPLRRLQGRGRVHAQSGQVLRQQRATARSACSRPRSRLACGASCFSSTAAVYGTPQSLARVARTRPCTPRTPTARASCWSSRCCAGSTPATACVRWRCATSMPRAPRSMPATAKIPAACRTSSRW
jgi:hypothetical protein